MIFIASEKESKQQVGVSGFRITFLRINLFGKCCKSPKIPQLFEEIKQSSLEVGAAKFDYMELNCRLAAF